MKGQAVADFLAEHPDPRATEIYEDLPDEVTEICLTQISFEGLVWQLLFDGASRTSPQGHVIEGVGVVLVSLQNYVIPRAFSLTEPCSNNVAEYIVLLIGMQIADDSKLIVNQVRGEYDVRHEDLVPYFNATVSMAERLETF